MVRERDFLGGPVVKTLHSQCRGTGSIPGEGIKIPQASWCGLRERKKTKGYESMGMS